MRDCSEGEIAQHVDANDNGALDPGELSATSDDAGCYQLTGLDAGDYVVRQRMPFGYNSTADATPSALAAPLRRKRPADRGPMHIIGGALADSADYPFIAAVGDLEGESFRPYCGASIISERWLVTAAHCTPDKDAASLGVLVGTSNIDDGSGLAVRVKSTSPHP